jgi:outer membrane protein TolC
MRKAVSVILAAAFIAGTAGPAVTSEPLPKCGRICVGERGIWCAREQTYMDGSVRPGEGALTLSDCYQLALKQSEIIAINADMIKEADARFLQAISIILPSASFISDDYQEDAGPPPITGSSATSAEFSSQEPERRSTRRFNVKQTLFRGFKAFAAIRASKYDKSRRIDEKIRAEQLLLVDVSNAFYLLIEKRQDLVALNKIRRALSDRVKELRAREKLGRSRPSEIVNAKTQLYTVESTIQVVTNQEILALQLLEFLIGRPVDHVEDSYDIPTELKDEDYYVAKSEHRPDVLAAKYAALLAKEEYRIVDSDFLPTATFEANGYTQRTGFYKGVDWDVNLKVSVPLFDVDTLGRSQQYALKADEKDLEFRRKKRRAPYDIKDAYVSLRTALNIQDSLRKAYTTAKLNYYLQRRDYRRSLVNNLDVLQAIQTLQDAQRNYIHALYEAKRLYWQLRVAVGEGITETLNDAF